MIRVFILALLLTIAAGPVFAASLDPVQDKWFKHYKKQKNVPKPEEQLVNTDKEPALKEDDWNRLTIQAKGDTIKTWLNGVPAAHWKTDTYLKGVFGLQIHKGNQGKVHWRGLKVKPLTK